MLEQIDLSQDIEKEAYETEMTDLRNRLVLLQQEVREAKIPVLVVVEGWETSGKGDIINRLAERLDPRWLQAHLITDPIPEEKMRPFLWRYWCKTPRRGEIALFAQSWYRTVLIERFEKKHNRSQIDQIFRELLQFERHLSDDGAVIIKFWLHISEKEQAKRVKKILKDPNQAWRLDKRDQRLIQNYQKYGELVEEMLEKTSPPNAPWHIVPCESARFGRLKIFRTIVSVLETAIQEHKARVKMKPLRVPVERHHKPTILDRVDLSKTVEEEVYRKELGRLQVRFRELEFELFNRRIPLVIVFEGWDAAGKGGNIRRLTEKLDPRGYRVTSIGPPSEQEKAHHFLWRFWLPLQKAGHISIFDRSWYGRVLVERVEGFCSPEEWWRAYQEINEFEEQLHSFGTIVTKFWIHISQEEQLKRFHERENTPHKRWKITDEDWRNREKWNVYEDAVIDMLMKTSTTYAPWIILEGNCKYHARLKTLRHIIQRVEERLG